MTGNTPASVLGAGGGMRVRGGTAMALLLALSAHGAGAAGGMATASAAAPAVVAAPAIRVTSPAFRDGAPIPSKYTCDGADVSPPLAWQGLPGAARSIALVCDDPDAPVGTWVHWVLFNLPARSGGLPVAVPRSASLANGARQGTNDFRKSGYGGPCPPPGKPHRYYFKVYALDAHLALAGAVTKRTLEAAMQGHVLAQGRLMGTYRK